MCFTLNLEVELEEDPGKYNGSIPLRKCTDTWALLLTIAFYVTVTGLTIYCFMHSDMTKLFNGYDDCGNICGRNNIKPPSIRFECYGENMEKRKYTYIKFYPECGFETKECVANCTTKGAILMSRFCVFDRKFIPYYIELYDFYRYITLFSITFLNGIVMYNSFCRRYKNLKPIKSVIVAVTVLIMAAFLSFGIYAYHTTRDYVYFIQLLIFSIIAFVIFILVLPSLCYFHSAINLQWTFEIHREAMDAIQYIPKFWLFPVLSFFAIISLTFLLVFCIITLKSYSYLDGYYEDNEEIIDYTQHPISVLTEALLIFAFFLLCELIKNLQTTIIGGCVAQWYFTKTGERIINRVKNCTFNIFKYHFGSVCLCSLILSLTYPLRIFINAINGAARLTYKECSPNIICWGLTSRKGLTMTAIYGYSFCAGNARAHKLLNGNLYNVAALRKLGDFYFICWKLLGWFFTLGACLVILTHKYGNTKEILVITVCFCFWSAIIIECFATGVEVAIDTVFLCFCEDCLFNNGTSKPYYMSANFARFVENANKYVDPVRWNTVAEYWAQGPGQLY